MKLSFHILLFCAFLVFTGCTSSESSSKSTKEEKLVKLELKEVKNLGEERLKSGRVLKIRTVMNSSKTIANKVLVSYYLLIKKDDSLGVKTSSVGESNEVISTYLGARNYDVKEGENTFDIDMIIPADTEAKDYELFAHLDKSETISSSTVKSEYTLTISANDGKADVEIKEIVLNSRESDEDSSGIASSSLRNKSDLSSTTNNEDSNSSPIVIFELARHEGDIVLNHDNVKFHGLVSLQSYIKDAKDTKLSACIEYGSSCRKVQFYETNEKEEIVYKDELNIDLIHKEDIINVDFNVIIKKDILLDIVKEALKGFDFETYKSESFNPTLKISIKESDPSSSDVSTKNLISHELKFLPVFLAHENMDDTHDYIAKIANKKISSKEFHLTDDIEPAVLKKIKQVTDDITDEEYKKSDEDTDKETDENNDNSQNDQNNDNNQDDQNDQNNDNNQDDQNDQNNDNNQDDQNNDNNQNDGNQDDQNNQNNQNGQENQSIVKTKGWRPRPINIEDLIKARKERFKEYLKNRQPPNFKVYGKSFGKGIYKGGFGTGAYLKSRSALDNNGLSVKTDGVVKVKLLGSKYDIIRAWANGYTRPDKFEDTGYDVGLKFIGINIYSKSDDLSNKDGLSSSQSSDKKRRIYENNETINSRYTEEQQKNLVSYHTDISYTKTKTRSKSFTIGPVPITVRGRASGTVGFYLKLNFEGIRILKTELTPYTNMKADASAGIGGFGFSGGAGVNLKLVSEKFRTYSYGYLRFVKNNTTKQVTSFVGTLNERILNEFWGPKGRFYLYVEYRVPKWCKSWGIPYPCGTRKKRPTKTLANFRTYKDIRTLINKSQNNFKVRL